ncbi:vitamin K epoxide reductase family protein [Myxacorys almedinensis]|uniref:Vitamin K epoxide reductase n=1 Tax=Myxacorys almedinensis A TaxID=2690445 RepID=A0A8J7Z473_9CYAN|nr:vitamin K epoxide reductase family protein [Myxacorys almedinensis]NDJ17813.1 vitamin K epoxide reductase [Myxacorys almedinensis A]
MEPKQLSEELRKGQNPDLTRRRFIVGLSFLGATMAEAVSMYQVGIIEELPDLPIPGIDSSKVDASDYAYQNFDTPDGFMMLANYSVTALLAGAGGKDRATQAPFLPITMAAKTLFDSILALRLARIEWRDNEALCAYCQVATLCSLTSFILAIPEARTAFQHLFGQRDRGTA